MARKKVRRWIKIPLIVISTVVGALVLTVGSYVIYIVAQYSRIEDNKILEINRNSQIRMELDGDRIYTAATYNIGFGAYDPDFDFFMDVGYHLDEDGRKITDKGHSSRAKSKEGVLAATNGVISELSARDPDFALYQEVDTDSDRSHHVNQMEMIKEHFAAFDSSFAVNFHSAYLFYPLYEPHGTVNSGIMTLSKYQIASSIRRSFPVTSAFPTKFFDLDRCFSVNRFALEGDKEFVLINLHMSAYDEGGKVRALQIEMLKDVLKDEHALGNYVMAGGDYNHDLLNIPKDDANKPGWMDYKQLTPDWLAYIDEERDLPEQFSLAAGRNAPTCRGSDAPLQAGFNFMVVIDGFAVSDNIEVIGVENIDNGFKYSDHQAAVMKFKLKV